MQETVKTLPLRLDGITKRFGATRALSDVSFDLYPGEVHALMGENGAGKSTLMKILAGDIRRDSGRILLDGREVEIHSPRDATALGIAVIHQELNVVPTMTVAENLALAREPRTRFGRLDRRAMLRSARQKLERIGADIDPGTEFGRLSVGLQQMVEIARAISENARILVLDEPTAALSRAETNELFTIIRELRAQGWGLIYISHRMEEVWKLADRITVLRDGKHVGTKEKNEIRQADVVRMMVGRDIGELYRRDDRRPGEPVLEVDALTDGAGIGPASLTVHAGEVVCLAGLIGAGRTELARLIFGADVPRGGSVRLHGREGTATRPRRAIDAGIAMLPESRKDQALFLDMTVQDNIAISALDRNSTAGVLHHRNIRKVVTDQTHRLGIRLSALPLPVRQLSGGNQQKVILARWLLTAASVIILDEPTRGVDIGAKSEIYEVVNELARQGRAVLVISSDLPEAIGISDRILVLRSGRIVHELNSRTASEEEVMFHATGTNVQEEATL
jgi:ribose transport system ATP-binding protein